MGVRQFGHMQKEGMMAKIPERPEIIFEELTADYHEIFGGELQSIVLYGSAARGEYVPKKSDINFMIVLTDRGMGNLKNALPLVEKWRKCAVAIPLFVTDIYLKSSLDVFPIEFFNIKAHHKLVYGQDLIKGIEIKKSDLRRECEREIKGKLLHLRQGYFVSQAKRKKLVELFSVSLDAFINLFPAILNLVDEQIPAKKKEILDTTVMLAQLDGTLFQTLWGLKTGTGKLSEEEAARVWQLYVEQVQLLGRFVDRLEV